MLYQGDTAVIRLKGIPDTALGGSLAGSELNFFALDFCGTTGTDFMRRQRERLFSLGR
jgi:hypothetical protein